MSQVDRMSRADKDLFAEIKRPHAIGASTTISLDGCNVDLMMDVRATTSITWSLMRTTFDLRQAEILYDPAKREHFFAVSPSALGTPLPSGEGISIGLIIFDVPGFLDTTMYFDRTRQLGPNDLDAFESVQPNTVNSGLLLMSSNPTLNEMNALAAELRAYQQDYCD